MGVGYYFRGKSGSLQLRMALSYILIIIAVLVLLNTYPLVVSQNMVFRSNRPPCRAAFR